MSIPEICPAPFTIAYRDVIPAPPRGLSLYPLPHRCRSGWSQSSEVAVVPPLPAPHPVCSFCSCFCHWVRENATLSAAVFVVDLLCLWLWKLHPSGTGSQERSACCREGCSVALAACALWPWGHRRWEKTPLLLFGKLNKLFNYDILYTCQTLVWEKQKRKEGWSFESVHQLSNHVERKSQTVFSSFQTKPLVYVCGTEWWTCART